MKVRLHIYLERHGDGREATWWAESPDAPGFYAVADHLQELVIRSGAALHEVLSEGRSEPVEVDLEPFLIGEPPATAADEELIDRFVAEHVRDAGRNEPTLVARVA